MVVIVSIASAEKYFELDVNYFSGSLTFNGISLREIDRTIKYADESGFLVKTTSFDGSDITKIYYNISEDKNYLIYMPYDKNAEKILIYNPTNSIVMDVDTSSFANTCGNVICEPYESYENCPKDCKSGSKDGFCDGVKDGICDPDCTQKTDPDCAETTSEINKTITPQIEINNQENIVNNEQTQVQNPNYLLWALPVFAVVVIGLSFLLIKNMRENKVVNILKQYIGDNIRKGFTLQQIKEALYRAGYKEKEIDKAVKNI